MNANPATRKRSFLLVCLWRAKSSEAEILEQKKPRVKARDVLRFKTSVGHAVQHEPGQKRHTRQYGQHDKNPQCAVMAGIRFGGRLRRAERF